MSAVGPKPEVAALRRDVCFNPESGHWTDIRGGPFSAKSGHSQRGTSPLAGQVNGLVGTKP